MTSSAFLTHNPATVWPVPDEFRPIYSHAAELQAPARALFISGQFGVRPDGTLADGFERQCEQAMDNVEALLAAAADFPALGRIRRERWAASVAPSVTAIAVAGLARPEYLIEIEAVAAAQS